MLLNIFGDLQFFLFVVLAEIVIVKVGASRCLRL